MKSIRNVLASLIVFGGFVASINLLYAQETGTLNQSETGSVAATTDASALSDVEVEVKAVEMTTPLPAAAAPESGNFYSTQHLPGTADEWPPLPADTLNLPVWPLGDDFYLLADENVDYAALQTQSLSANGGMRAMTDFAPLDLVSGTLVAGTNLWLAITNLANGTAGLRLSNTLADVQYEIQATTNLTQSQWVSIGTVLGSEITNWTAASVAAAGDPALFLRVRSDLDSDNIGIPDWWQLEYFGYVGIDPNGDPAGDGWSNAQKYEYGMNPKVFDTPPAPQGLTASYNSGNGTATVTWLPSPGPVTSYTLQRNYDSYPYYPNLYLGPASQTFTIAAGMNHFADDLSSVHPNPSSGNLDVSYTIQANYAGGNSAWSGLAQLEQSGFSVCLVPGAQGSAVLAVSSLPAHTVALQITRTDDVATDYGDFSYNTNFEISATTNGLYSLPNENIPSDIYYNNPLPEIGDTWYVTALGTNGPLSVAIQVSEGFINWQDDPTHVWLVPPYFDGRAQLKQNLIFSLRAATVDAPFHFANVSSDGFYNDVTNSPNYVYSGFYNFTFLQDPNIYPETWFNPMQPFQNNYLYRNFVFDPAELDSGGRITNGVFGSYTLDYVDLFSSTHDAGVTDSLGLNQPAAYQFSIPTVNNVVISPLLATNQTRWLCSYPLDTPPYDGFDGTDYYTTYLAEIGCIDYFNLNNFTTYCQMFSDVRNIYGLPFVSAAVTAGGTPGVVSAGGTLNDTYGSYFYPETAQPQLQPVEYDFWNAPFESLAYGDYDYDGTNAIPGMTNFFTGRTSDLLVTSVGNANFNIVGYAKLAVTNGYPGVYGYLGQYFDQAYQITNGVVTTNTTGVLSPYGQFFATQPGPAALVTMPDPDTGARGTATVYTVSAVIDRTQGSNMDLSFNGANATSPANPAVAWCNNNYDRGHTVDGTDFEQDDLGPVDIANLPAYQQVPDCDYVDASGQSAIPSTRDLEDYFRLWTPGVAALMKVLPSNYTVQLTLAGAGQIRIFQAVEPDGGTNYLFDETTASNQVVNSTSLYVGLLTSSSPIIFNITTNFNEHFIFCGAAVGSAQIDLQVLDGSLNVIADAPVFLQINDIKNMYERWTVGDEANVTPTATATLAVNDMPSPPQSPFQYTAPQDANTPYILFVHGWNMQPWEKDRYAEAAYKRLYWQGYQGRFGIFQWPTGNGLNSTISTLLDARNYDNSESNAWASAVGLTNLLTQLNTEYPSKVYLMAHSMGNVVAGEALRLADSQLVNTYIAMQGAVPAHCYDPSTVNRSTYSAPDRYANYYTSGAPSYFSSSAGAGAYVNFYNTNDWALSWWNVDEGDKPDNGLGGIGINYPGYFYSSSSGFYKIAGSQYNLSFPANTYEIFAYADPSWSYALGAQAGVGGAFQLSGVPQQINLPSVWPIDTHPQTDNKPFSAHVWHSAEFRSDNMSRALFWNTLLKQMFP